MNKIIRDTIILTIITVIAGFSLGAVYNVTKEPIANAAIKKKEAAFKEVMPDAKSFETVYDEKNANDNEKASIREALDKAELNEQNVMEIALAKSDDGKDIGYVLTTVTKGFGGDFDMTVGISNDDGGKVTGVAFLTMNESPGLGDNAKKPEFKDQYLNKNVQTFKVVKTDPSAPEDIKAMSGATITSKAVTKGVNAALVYYHEVLVKEGQAK